MRTRSTTSADRSSSSSRWSSRPPRSPSVSRSSSRSSAAARTSLPTTSTSSKAEPVHARDLLDLAWVIPALPALGAVVLLLFGKRLGEPAAGWIATTLMVLAFAASVIAFFALRSLPADHRTNVSQGFTWIQAGGFRVDFRFLVDPLSSTMTLFVTGVGALIHLYSISYMDGDARFSRFFAYMNLFAASMLVLVLGSSFLLTFMGWEGVGLCSYLLISFWFDRA